MQQRHGIDVIKRARPEIFVVPCVFANGKRDAPARRGGATGACRGKVALLVEDVVIGKQHFGLHECGLAVTDEDGDVGMTLPPEACATE